MTVFTKNTKTFYQYSKLSHELSKIHKNYVKWMMNIALVCKVFKREK